MPAGPWRRTWRRTPSSAPGERSPTSAVMLRSQPGCTGSPSTPLGARDAERRPVPCPNSTRLSVPDTDPLGQPERVGEVADLRRALGEAIGALPIGMRAVVVLKDVYGWSRRRGPGPRDLGDRSQGEAPSGPPPAARDARRKAPAEGGPISLGVRWRQRPSPAPPRPRHVEGCLSCQASAAQDRRLQRRLAAALRRELIRPRRGWSPWCWRGWKSPRCVTWTGADHRRGVCAGWPRPPPSWWLARRRGVIVSG